MEDRATVRKIRLGLISFGDTVMRCKTREITASGAILAVTDPLTVPDQFDLIVPSENLVEGCAVIWRDARRIGVTFR
jgi:hypothetical protein